MSIDDGFRKMLAGVKQADEGRDEIMAGLELAWQGVKDRGFRIATDHDLSHLDPDLRALLLAPLP